MPKGTHAFGETPKPRKQEKIAVNDTALNEHLRLLRGQEKEETQTPEKSEKKEQNEKSVPHGPAGDIIKEVRHAHKGSVVFMHGIVAKHGREHSPHLARQSHGAKNHVKSVRDFFKDDENVIVLGWRELQAKGVREDSKDATEAIKHLALKYPGKTIVLDIAPALDSILYKPWEKLGGGIAGLQRMHGPMSEGWLATWLRQHKTKHETLNGKSELWRGDVEEALREALHELRQFRSAALGGRELSFGLEADNPMSLAFLLYAASGSLEPEMLSLMLRGPHRQKHLTGFVTISERQISVDIGGKRFSRGLAG